MIRVTNTMLTRRYMGNMNTSLSDLSKSMNKISSGKQYSRLSENPLDNSRAMRLEEDLYKNTQYTKILEDSQTELASAESNLMDVIDVLTTSYERAIKAGTGTTAEEDRAVIAGEIDSYIEFVVKSMNATFNDKFLFSNTNNSDKAPFEVTDDGKVLFNGADVDDIFKGEDGNFYATVRDDDGEIVYEDGDAITNAQGYAMYKDNVTGDEVYYDDVNNLYYNADGTDVTAATTPANLEQQFEQVPQSVLVMESNTRYVDMGLGMSFDSNGNVIGASALEVSFGGLDALGFGLDENGLPNNVLSILVDLRDATYTEGEEFDLDHFGSVADHLIEVKNTTNFYVSNIGTRSNYMEKSISRLNDEEYNLTSLKKLLVEVDSAEEIISYKQFEFAWNAILQMGNKIIPTSLMDFVN